MARQRPAWYYERLATRASAREAYYRNNPPAPTTTVNSRGPATTVYYRSLLVRDGLDPAVFSTQVYDSTLALVTAAEAGLLTTAPADTAVRRLRGSGVMPTKASWYQGDATPVAQTTAWGSRWIRYYDTAGGQSHYSIPFSAASGAFTANDLIQRFNTLFQASQNELLGTSNGRAQLTFERAPVSYLT